MSSDDGAATGSFLSVEGPRAVKCASPDTSPVAGDPRTIRWSDQVPNSDLRIPLEHSALVGGGILHGATPLQGSQRTILGKRPEVLEDGDELFCVISNKLIREQKPSHDNSHVIRGLSLGSGPLAKSILSRYWAAITDFPSSEGRSTRLGLAPNSSAILSVNPI